MLQQQSARITGDLIQSSCVLLLVRESLIGTINQPRGVNIMDDLRECEKHVHVRNRLIKTERRNDFFRPFVLNGRNFH